MDKQTQRTKYKCENITEIVYQKKKKVKCIQMQPFEHEAYNIVYLGLRVVSKVHCSLESGGLKMYENLYTSILLVNIH